MAAPPARTNLGPSLTSFIGREAELASLAQRFSREGLLTILGPPGVGKTRLAREFALRRLATGEPAAAGGVFFCDLEEARDARDICRVVGRALEVPLSSSGEAISRLGA